MRRRVQYPKDKYWCINNIKSSTLGRVLLRKKVYFIQVFMVPYKHRVSLMKHDIILFNKGKARRNNFKWAPSRCAVTYRRNNFSLTSLSAKVTQGRECWYF
jgi:hypothetical protein